MGEFDQTIGFSLMSVFVNTYLTGLIMSQFFTYWNAINTTQAGAVVYMSWNFANPRVVARKDSLPREKPHLNPVIQNKILIGFLVATSAAACGMGVAAAIKAWILSEQAELVLVQPISEVNLALQCGIDVIIADRVFDRLIRTAVQSGFFTAVFALGILFSFRFSADTYMMSLFAVPIGRIYTNTMMDHFLSRENLRDTLSISGNMNTVPNFNATCGASDGTIVLPRNVSNRTNITQTNETV
ncbi:hypothetical protein B0H14DRAFT_2561431 [Mycena olivaceomarginata]|nr:hypothetical protein B0H14DRAFT_2561431 [Mycena olivaceomarginata]